MIVNCQNFPILIQKIDAERVGGSRSVVTVPRSGRRDRARPSNLGKFWLRAANKTPNGTLTRSAPKRMGAESVTIPSVLIGTLTAKTHLAVCCPNPFPCCSRAFVKCRTRNFIGDRRFAQAPPYPKNAVRSSLGNAPSRVPPRTASLPTPLHKSSERSVTDFRNCSLRGI